MYILWTPETLLCSLLVSRCIHANVVFLHSLLFVEGNGDQRLVNMLIYVRASSEFEGWWIQMVLAICMGFAVSPQKSLLHLAYAPSAKIA